MMYAAASNTTTIIVKLRRIHECVQSLMDKIVCTWISYPQ